jgi:hypothetical protein
VKKEANMDALWMALLFVLLGADLLGIGILEVHIVDIESCLICCVMSATFLSYHAVTKIRGARRRRREEHI